MTSLGYYVGKTTYDNEDVLESFRDLRKTISDVKRIKKGKDPKEHKDKNESGEPATKLGKNIAEALLSSVKQKKRELTENNKKHLGK